MRVLLLLLLPAFILAQDGLYVSNSTDILWRRETDGQVISLHHDANARIVGVTVDIAQMKIFWTDISLATRGIWAGTLGNGVIADKVRIVADDLGECNGIAVDWVSRHVYWTDASRRSIELANYDGTKRRALTIDGLKTPRGIVIDPNGGYMYWGDQGTKKIERARLDGSMRQSLIEQDLTWPNEMVILNSTLYFVDGSNKKLRRYNLDDSSVEDVKAVGGYTSDNPVFGLATDGTKMYISVWHQGKILECNSDGRNLDELANNLGMEPLFGMFYHRSQNQPVNDASSQPCKDGVLAGCSDLCLPIDATSKRCSCPSYGGLTLASDGAACTEPSDVLFYTLAAQGIVGYKDMDGATNDDRYLVGRSLRPVAVAYDPVDKMVYWSDVHESTVHKAHFTGTQHNIFMSSTSHSIGVVDGLAMDHIRRKLYYTNMGEVRVYANTHAWHKIELIGLDGTGRKTLVENIGKPRGLHLDLTNRYMYYTDWGANPAVVRTDLDGSNAEVLRVGLDNPNAITTIGNNVYVVDSHYKTRGNNNYAGEAMEGALYRMSNTGDSWTQLLGNLKVPFGLSVVGNDLYISDWELGLLSVSSPDGNPVSVTTLDDAWSDRAPMGMEYSPVSDTLDTTQSCNSPSCDEICIPEPNNNAMCTCDTYSPEVKDGSSCTKPNNFLLVGDHNAVKMVDLDAQTFHRDERPEPQVVIEGNSYFSNYVALAFHEDSNTVFYTDVNRGAIYSAVLGEEPMMLYNAGYAIDGMDLNTYDQNLYWTGITEPVVGTGIIARMKRNDNSTYEVIVGNLKRPRAIKVNHVDSEMFWTEWADGEQKVRRASIDGTDMTTILDSNTVSRPNGLDIDLGNRKLLIGDAGGPSIKECKYDGSALQELAFAGQRPEHIFSVKYVEPNQVMLTDWNRKAVSLLDRATSVMVDIVTDLMRPTEVLLVESSPSSSCPSGHGCSHTCNVIPGGYYCSCPTGQFLDTDEKTCSTTNAWVEVEEGECGDCDTNKVCAARLGGSTYDCHCKAGYQPDGASCQACDANTFKQHPGNDLCVTCMDGSSTGGSTGSTACTCSGGNSWNWADNTCGGSKPGTCPDTPISGYTCSDSCSNDAGCDGVKKCCSYSGCSSDQCLNPQDLDQGQCAFNDDVYQVGERFSPSPCVTCTCTLDKTYGNPLYGGAMCDNEECPPLSCEDTVLAAGACCLRCQSDQCEERPIQIINCPEEVQTVLLPIDAYVTSVRYEPETVDNCPEARSIEMVAAEVRAAWGDSQVTVLVRAPSRGGNGYDTDECVLRVRVQDNHAPTITCPPTTTIQVSSTSSSTQVTITSPTVLDNVCGQQRSDGLDYDGCVIELTDTNGDSMPVAGSYDVGTYNLRYTAKDAAGNSASCDFIYKIQQNENLHCDTPSVNNGQLNCAGNNEVTCTLTCNPDYSSTLTDVVASTCTAGGVWDPGFDPDLQQLGCAVLERLKVLTKLSIVGLQCPTYSKDVIAAGLEKSIQETYGLPRDQVQVLTGGCENGETDNFQVEIWLSADYSTPAEYIDLAASLTATRDQIQTDIVDGNLLTQDRTPLTGGTIDEDDPISGCRVGQVIDTVAEKCVRCPTGSKSNEAADACTLCPVDTYQDYDGRNFCKRCEARHFTNGVIGSTHRAQCVPIPVSPDEGSPNGGGGDDQTIFYVIGAVVVVVVIIAIIGGVCFMLKRKREAPAKKYEKKEVEGHDNQGMYEGEGTYDELPDGAQPDNGQPDNYETLDETKRKPDDPYDKINK